MTPFGRVNDDGFFLSVTQLLFCLRMSSLIFQDGAGMSRFIVREGGKISETNSMGSADKNRADGAVLLFQVPASMSSNRCRLNGRTCREQRSNRFGPSRNFLRCEVFRILREKEWRFQISVMTRLGKMFGKLGC